MRIYGSVSSFYWWKWHAFHIALGGYQCIYALFSQGICRVAVPIFFLISGYLFFINITTWNTNLWLLKLRKRVKTLFIPYVLWVCIAVCLYIVVFCLKAYINNDIPDCISWISERGWWRVFWDNGRYSCTPHTNILGWHIYKALPSNYPLWFIRDLIILNIISPLIFCFVRCTQKWGLLIVFVLYVLDIWYPYEGLNGEGFFFYSLGVYYGVNGLNLVNFCKKYEVVSYIISILLLVCCVLTFYIDGRLLYRIIRNIFTMSGTISMFCIVSNILAKRKFKTPKLLIESSFFIYTTHTLLIKDVVIIILSKLIPYTTSIAMISKYFLTSIMTVSICVLLYVIMKRVAPKILSVLIGGR